MKKLIVVSIMAALLLTVAVAAMADATNWLIKMNAATTGGLYPAGDISVGWYKNYTNGTDTNEIVAPTTPLPGSKNAVVAAVFDGTKASTKDWREPISSAAGDFKKMALPRTWTFWVYTQGAWNASDKIRLTIKPQVAPVGTFPASALPNGAKIEFKGAYNATFTAAEFAAKTTNWFVDLDSSYVDGTGQTVLYTAANPLTFTMTVTPEPSSIFALASGLAGLAGFAIRRRK